MTKNIAASVRARLLNIARNENIAFQIILTRFFHERLLFRLSRSAFSEQFCLKGGVLLYALEREQTRLTKDLDLLGLNISDRKGDITKVFQEICSFPFVSDGVHFDIPAITAADIIKDGNYKGIRLSITAFLDTIVHKLQVDIGFGDIVFPSPVMLDYPTLLDLEAPELLAYTPASVIAEKFHAMIELAELNSRMKDFFDVYQLLNSGNFSEQDLSVAITTTFEKRDTFFTPNHRLFTLEFAGDAKRLEMWKSFLKKAGIKKTLAFETVHQTITNHLKPIYGSLT